MLNIYSNGFWKFSDGLSKIFEDIITIKIIITIIKSSLTWLVNSTLNWPVFRWCFFEFFFNYFLLTRVNFSDL